MNIFKRTKHIELWDELASSGEHYKMLAKAMVGKNLANNCGACDAVGYDGHKEDTNSNEEGPCDNCPLEGPGGYCHLDDNSGLYDKWHSAENKEERKKYAAQIRDLPIRKNWKFE